jgi:hypothetical protein
VTQPTTGGYLTIYPNSKARPVASSLNWVAGDTIANLVLVPVIDGKVNFYNGSSGTVHVIGDLAGYYSAGTGSFVRVGPVRVLNRHFMQPKETYVFESWAGALITVPTNVTAVVLNVTVTEPAASGYVTVYPDGKPRPTASNLNWDKNETIANLVVVPVVNGRIDLYNGSAGGAYVIADLAGFFTS